MNQGKKTSKKLLFAWPTQTVSFTVASVILGYTTFFATDYMGISPGTVGILFMISKTFDGFTDIVAGYLIDRTHTKIGKARPYALASLGYWGFVILLFSAPQMSVNIGAIYLFVCYTMINSVFLTLTQCSESVYLANAIENSSQSVSVLSFGNLISMVFTMAGSIIVPQLIKTIGTTREGWRLIVIALGVPFMIVGLIRFLVVKEIRNGDDNQISKIRVKDMLRLLAGNKYILIFSVIIIVANIGNYLVSTASTYYYQYIMNDLGLASIMAITLLSVVIVIGITPALERQFGLTNIIVKKIIIKQI
ncbi:MFS transporter [Clostridium sp. D2Q-14]|uniref:MFS transporter n=1 Tax=Anaeromonas gelatinilytica TaxID=2683194 RepID=UPI00193B5F7D|nr:MFS transporter [Anaeromonas gelatinilytica]MBS4534889.1 MFS transporter [Anaeromonas gelatinilytica]